MYINSTISFCSKLIEHRISAQQKADWRYAQLKLSMQIIFWSATSNEERTVAIHSIERIVSKHGDLTDFKLFSDISISLVIEIKEKNIDSLWNELREHILIDKHEYLHTGSQRERTIYLNVSFAKGTGNLRIDTPSVPG